eukprot:1022068-Rhodomonas_salina.2
MLEGLQSRHEHRHILILTTMPKTPRTPSQQPDIQTCSGGVERGGNTIPASRATEAQHHPHNLTRPSTNKATLQPHTSASQSQTWWPGTRCWWVSSGRARGAASRACAHPARRSSCTGALRSRAVRYSWRPFPPCSSRPWDTAACGTQVQFETPRPFGTVVQFGTLVRQYSIGLECRLGRYQCSMRRTTRSLRSRRRSFVYSSAVWDASALWDYSAVWDFGARLGIVSTAVRDGPRGLWAVSDLHSAVRDGPRGL